MPAGRGHPWPHIRTPKVFNKIAQGKREARHPGFLVLFEFIALKGRKNAS